jgi:magnesium-protoporphyrin IX monomethyl ester (oxidative) cyclase
MRGEGEHAHLLMNAVRDGADLLTVPGAVTVGGRGPAPLMVKNLDGCLPARDLIPPRVRRKYFFPDMDPCESIEFSRGCPWDCNFCSAWTFYGRSYRKASPEAVVADLRSMAAPNAIIVDDVAFVHPEHGMAVADAIEKANIRKQFLLETRTDVFLKNPEVFARWVRLGLRWLFFGFDAIDDESLKSFRKRMKPNSNVEALELARKIGVPGVIINIIIDPNWEERDFARVREWAAQVPEHVSLTIQTPYPGTETWLTDARNLTTTDYRLFDVKHAVLPTRLPLAKFYEECVTTEKFLYHKHFKGGTRGLIRTLPGLCLEQIRRGQTNFAWMLWKYTFSRIYDPRERLRHHQVPVRYHVSRPHQSESAGSQPDLEKLYVHLPVVASSGKHGR